MQTATITQAPSVLHPAAAEFTIEPRPIERRVGVLFAATGVVLFAVMGVLGLLMRFTQAEVLHLSPAWFYRLLTLHGAGMITGAWLATMGAMWSVLHTTVALRPARMLAAYVLIVVGALAAVVSTLVGGFGAAWTFLPPLPSYPAGQWGTWAEALWFVAMLLVGTGMFVFSFDVLEQTTTAYGGLLRAVGWRFLRGQEAAAPPPQVIAATIITIDGLVAMTAGTAIVLGLLTHTYDADVAFDALVAKNLVYLFGHTIANLVIYLVVGAVYVILPRYAGRAYEVTKVFVAAWLVAGVLILAVFSHHLYMDFVQPRWAEVTSEIASYASLLPVAVVTIFSMTMLVWGSRYRWTLASTLLYLGLAGWAIGGTAAVIDSIIPFNFRFHNTVWVVGHFHTYLMMTVVFWVLAFLAHLLERDAGETSSPAARRTTITLLLVGGYGLTGTWFVAGVLGVPRRYAIQPPGTSGYSLAGSIFASLFALGFLAVVVQLRPLARAALERNRHVLVELRDSWTGGRYYAPRPRAEIVPPRAELDPLVRRGLPLATPGQVAAGTAACVVALSSFFPQVVDAAESSVRYHHLDHAGHFALGLLAGLVLGSLPAVSRLLGERPHTGLAAVIAAPAVMMLVMVPRFYEPLESNGAEHALFHLAMAALGLVAGLGSTRLGLVAGRFAAFLSLSMALMFAAAMKGS
jgi:cytochrome c oxidase subunit 1